MNEVSLSLPRMSTAVGRALRLREAIEGRELTFLMEAHNGLSAKIVEEAGFGGIWASGLTISASLGLRDSNEASWTQVLDVVEYMADATRLPILMDGDTGYGNFNNVRRLVRKLGDRNVAGVCIEDKLFPKTNSFIGEDQPLAEIDEFCGRIKAGKDSQTNDAFMLVARIEALISGRGMDEALRRAEAYHQAGADAVLIHSKKADAREILEFCRLWDNRAPVVIVPTTYYPTPTEVFRAAGISTVIWANHLMRAAMTAMRDTAGRIQRAESLIEVEDRVASVKDIFQLVGNAELEAAERRYLPEAPRARAVVLAASGGDLGDLTRDRPKCMVEVRGRALLEHLVATLSQGGIRDIGVVRGYAKAAVVLPGIRTIDNDRFADTGELASLIAADEMLHGELVVSYGDVLFRTFILRSLLGSKADVVLAVDAAQRPGDRHRDLVLADHGFSGRYLDDVPARLVRMGDLGYAHANGEWMGLVRFSAQGTVWLREEIALMQEDGTADTADLPTLLTRIAGKHPVRIKYFTGHWLDVNTLTDVADACNFA